MSYSDFTINSLKEKFCINFSQNEVLFPSPPIQKISDELKHYLDKYISLALAIDTEKARSEYIIAPILGELKMCFRDRLSLFSGTDFNVDKESGLSGRCDYIISRSPDQYSLAVPVVMLVEAKNDNIKSGIPQCAAEMIAAQIYNETQQNAIASIYGCISTGTNWKFLKLAARNIAIDPLEYYIDTPEKIMGILSSICLED